MAKEILLYQPIYSYTAESFIKALDDNKGSDICVRMNCPGGDVMAGIGMLAKYQEHTGNKKIKVDGRAASMAAYFCCIASDVECLNVSDFLFHRAAFPDWVEQSKDLFTDEMKAMLNKHNTFLRGLISSKIGDDIWKKFTGKSLDDVFSLDKRIDVSLTAEQAKKMGLVNNVFPLTAPKKKEINALAAEVGIAALYTETQAIDNNNQNSTIMTLAEFKVQHAAIYAEAQTEILAKEKDRIDCFNAWAETDPKAVLAAIVSGEPYKESFGAKMQVMAMSQKGLQNISDAGAKAIVTDDPEKKPATEADVAQAAYDKEIAANLASRYGITA